MKVKTAKLVRPALDWAVVEAQGLKAVFPHGQLFLDHGKGNWSWYEPSTAWGHGGPIIEREGIGLEQMRLGDGWHATIGCTLHDFLMWDEPYDLDAYYAEGPTPLVAAMRCFVASELGGEVDIPEELLT